MSFELENKWKILSALQQLDIIGSKKISKPDIEKLLNINPKNSSRYITFLENEKYITAWLEQSGRYKTKWFRLTKKGATHKLPKHVDITGKLTSEEQAIADLGKRPEPKKKAPAKPKAKPKGVKSMLQKIAEFTEPEPELTPESFWNSLEHNEKLIVANKLQVSRDSKAIAKIANFSDLYPVEKRQIKELFTKQTIDVIEPEPEPEPEPEISLKEKAFIILDYYYETQELLPSGVIDAIDTGTLDDTNQNEMKQALNAPDMNEVKHILIKAGQEWLDSRDIEVDDKLTREINIKIKRIEQLTESIQNHENQLAKLKTIPEAKQPNIKTKIKGKVGTITRLEKRLATTQEALNKLQSEAKETEMKEYLEKIRSKKTKSMKEISAEVMKEFIEPEPVKIKVHRHRTALGLIADVLHHIAKDAQHQILSSDIQKLRKVLTSRDKNYSWILSNLKDFLNYAIEKDVI
jgi:hypothetical protein